MDIVYVNRLKSNFSDILLFAIVLGGLFTFSNIGHLPLLLSQITEHTFLNVSLLSSLILLGYFQLGHHNTSYYCWNFLLLFSFLIYLTNIDAAWLSYVWYFMWILSSLFFLILYLLKKKPPYFKAIRYLSVDSTVYFYFTIFFITQRLTSSYCLR